MPACREGIKLVLLAPLAIVRMLLIFLTLAVFAILCTIATVGAPQGKPLSPWRRKIVLGSRWLGKLVVLLLGFWVTVKGWENYTNAVKHGTVRAMLVFQLLQMSEWTLAVFIGPHQPLR